MAWLCITALLLTACGRIGFDSAAAGDGAVGDGAGGGDGTTVDTSPAPPATVLYVSTAEVLTNLATYTFLAQNIGIPAANRIVVVCAYLGGGATTNVSSITVGGVALGLTAQVTDGVSGAWAIGYKTIPNGAGADITVTSGGAGRAAIAVYNVTASNEAPAGSGQFQSSANDASTLTLPFVFGTDSVVIANAGYGSNNRTWTWGGTWTGYTEHVDSAWSEQGSYTTAAASVTTTGFGNITATPSGATQKMINAAEWR